MLDFWYPWYPSVYQTNTMHLTAEQDGIYRRLIDYYMQSNAPLPENMTAIARIAGTTLDCLEHAWGILGAFFEYRPGIGYTHKMCDRVLIDMNQRREKRVAKASHAASVRHKKTQQIQDRLCSEHATSNHQAMLGRATVQDSKLQEEDNSSNDLLSFAVNDQESLTARPKKKPPDPVINFDYENGDWLNINEKHRKAWDAAYPALNIDQELAAAASWLIGNPKNRKTNHGKFLTNWLARQQDKPRSSGNGQQHRSNSSSYAATHFQPNGGGGDSMPAKSKWITEGERLAAKYRAAAAAEGNEQR